MKLFGTFIPTSSQCSQGFFLGTAYIVCFFVVRVRLEELPKSKSMAEMGA